MSNFEIGIASAALAIALVAFLTTFGQLLQQYFATADGYRRCQRSVMGEWAVKTRLRWRWREFRFETLYTTPEIFMTSITPDRIDQIVIAGGTDSRLSTMVPGPGYSKYSHETVCWISLLHQLHLCTERGGFTNTPGISLPALIFRERSWDFQLPDVVLPLAICTVSDIAIIARRLGMRWKDFRPYDGSLKAEGHFHVMSSTTVRSLGIVMQYGYSWKEDWRQSYQFGMVKGIMKEREEIYMPTGAADCLGFGIVRGYAELYIPDFTLGTRNDVVAALGLLDASGNSAAILRDRHKSDPDYHLRTGDLVAMTMVMARLRGRSHIQVPAPSENMHGFSTSIHGRRAFRECLKKHIETCPDDTGPQSLMILASCGQLRENWREWEHKSLSRGAGFGDLPHQPLPVKANKLFLDAVHDEYDMATRWVVGHNNLAYRRILGAHIKHVILRDGGETEVQATHDPEYEREVLSYFLTWPGILQDLEDEHFCSSPLQSDELRRLYFDTWVVMLFRACCWGACHRFVPGERVPSQHYGSQLPVYIG
ncbi:hypothetical protein B0O99DRAFT_617935 [Bisporella sp. PMI_857]|nr:hypothetical protein B0O99DRAFT_617935 [Bisporella sp. PMI_857]